MNKALIAVLAVFLAMSLSCKSTDTGSKAGAAKGDKVKEGPGKILWEGDRSLKGSGNFKNYKKEGEWTLFHRHTGEKLASGNYKDDKQSGRWSFFYKDGQKMTEGDFDEDQRTGPWVEFHPKGEKKSEMSYIIVNKVFPELGMTERIGVLNGPKTSYFPSGKVMKEETYREGDLTGVANEYYEDGKLKERSQYAGGKHDGSANTYWPTGKHKEQGGYRVGKKNGLWIFYHGNGMLHMKGQFQEDNQTGPWIYQSALGQPMKEGRFKLETVTVQKKASTRSNEDGYWNFYRAAGGRSEKVMDIMLSNGMIDGTKPAKFYENGKLSGEGAFQMGLTRAIFEIVQDGTPKGTMTSATVPPDEFDKKITYRWTGEWEMPKKSGKWTFYYPNGKVKAEGEFMVNKKNGDWKVYRPDGSLDAEQSGMYRFDRKSKF
jgi:antitoxin component YwqK of YwqJK toxin-antitoxin module